MSTINELLDELKTIKEALRTAINNAWGEEVLSTEDCLDAYAEHIDGLCPCPTHCISFQYGEGEASAYGGTIKVCGIEDDGCLTYDRIPGKPSFPEMDDHHWVFRGWSTDGSEENIVTTDICNVTEDITYYAVYIKEWQYIFYESDGTTIIKQGYILNGNQLLESDVPTPTIPSGYELSRWDVTSNTGTDIAIFPYTVNDVTGDVTFTPVLKPSPTEEKYIISTDYNDTESLVSINYK